ncbi:MAG: hypothetical protein ACYC0V_15070 [Armatimonadota bacterium]
MKLSTKILVLALLVLLAVGVFAAVDQVTVPKGTEVILAFDQALSSKTAKVGDSVALHVQKNVVVDGKTVLTSGTKVKAVISKVDKKKRYGINAKMRMVINPVKSTYGQMINLEPRSKGQYVGGKKSTQAGGATAGGAILLGPVGLAGGYFIKGKSVTIKVGDQLSTEVAATVTLSRK